MLNTAFFNFFILLLSFFLSSQLFAEEDRSDFDLDDDGLIEINDIDDFHNIHFNLDGKTLYKKSDGCPEKGCRGFELMTDIDFDSNQSGVFDKDDKYWTGAYGWVPFAARNKWYFTAELHGNGHLIKNLYIKLDENKNHGYSPLGLISKTKKGAYIHDLAIIGYIEGDRTTGLLIGNAEETRIERVAAFGKLIVDDRDVGMIVGELKGNSELLNSFSSGYLKAGTRSGGLAGAVYVSKIENSYTVAYVENGKETGEAIGYVSSSSSVSSTYWLNPKILDKNFYSSGSNATQRENDWYLRYMSYSAKEQLLYADIEQNRLGLNITHLRCATDANLASENLEACYSDSEISYYAGVAKQIIKGWFEKEEDKKPTFIVYADWSSDIWDFGNRQQLPRLKMGERIYGDFDVDGLEDSMDQWPEIFAASEDKDQDNHPDYWHERCDGQCQKKSGLLLDRYLNNKTLWQDDDDDGLPESCDAQCETTNGLAADKYPKDKDNDGIFDDQDTDIDGDGNHDADADHDGLIDIETLEELYAIRFQTDGLGQKLTQKSKLDMSGCPRVWYQGKFEYRCHGYELLNDLDFDTNANGIADKNDEFWNDGEGWSPIFIVGKSNFSAVFEGNGKAIKNLYINSKELKSFGLFSHIENSTIRNIALDGSIYANNKNYSHVGLLAGGIGKSYLHNIVVRGKINGKSQRIGMLASEINESQIHNIAVYGVINTPDHISGMIANKIQKSQLRNILVSGRVTGAFLARYNQSGTIAGEIKDTSIQHVLTTAVGFNQKGNELDIIGYGIYDDDSSVKSVYWLAKKMLEKRYLEAKSYEAINSRIGLTLEQFKCTNHFNYIDIAGGCALTKEIAIYQGFSEDNWQFSEKEILPGLRVGDSVYYADTSDQDFDGYDSNTDKFPDNPFIALDKDEDGVPDEWNISCDKKCQEKQIEQGIKGIDRFPNHKTLWQDIDRDGLPEQCDKACEELTGLKKDKYPNDYDNDGIVDSKDPDQNGDGIRDIDADHDGLVEINSMEQFNKIRHQLDGKGLRDSKEAELKTSGCPWVHYRNTMIQECHGYELTKNITMDSNRNGKFDNGDTFWNEGRGWQPIWQPFGSENYFTAELNGNGFTIDKIYMDGSKNEYSSKSFGLFREVRDARIYNLALKGTIKGRDNHANGLLAAYAKRTRVDRVAVTVDIDSFESRSGGIVGVFEDSELTNSISYGVIRFAEVGGGLVGESRSSTIKYSINTVRSRYQQLQPSLNSIVGLLKDSASLQQVYRAVKKGKSIHYYQFTDLESVPGYSGHYCRVKNDDRSEHLRGDNYVCQEKKVKVIDTTLGWDLNIWDISKGRLPRLK